MTLVVQDKEALRTGGNTKSLVQGGRGGTGRAVVCRWTSTLPAGGMTLSACVHVIQEAAGGTLSCTDAVLEAIGLQEQRFLRFAAAQTV